MCGIVGVVETPDRVAAERAVSRAMGLLAHRGPDASGIYEDPLIRLGHRRLSILDTADRANQPMISPSRQAVIVLNGEIYNFRELRADLEHTGEHFSTTSDTEVLLRVLEREGTAGLSRLKGMFALALWRPDRGELLLARDRFGEKPLFVAAIGRSLAFASEIAALLELPGVGRRLNAEALGYFLECGYVPPPLTMFQGLLSLNPGEWLLWRDGATRCGDYATIEYRPDPELAEDQHATRAVLDALRAAVRRQMVSDVPLGAFLSGGIDSSSVVALMQEQSPRPVMTFNVRFEDAAYDESPIARHVAEYLGTDHHELTVTDAGFAEEDLWRVVDRVGMPFHDSSAIPTYVVSRYARQHVTVALSGDGGDEMFAGYPAFQWGDRLDRLARVPRPLLRLGRRVADGASRLPGLRGSTGLRQGRKALQFASIEDEATRFRALHWLFDRDERSALLEPAIRAQALDRLVERLTGLPGSASSWTPLRRMMYSRLRHDLPADMLVKVDRMSMAASLEVRAPFLDPDVAELSMRLPDAHLIKNGVGKHVLREAVRPLLPAEVFDHPKWGFSLPLHRFVNDRFREVARGLLDPGGPLRGLLQPAHVQRVLARGLAREADAADVSVYQATHQLWALMQLAAWIQRFRVSA